MTTVVFLGPSLDIRAAQSILPDAVFLPPARQADLVSAVATYAPHVIGLIDGTFGQSLAVWHKEILYALEQGVEVYGAASMGALRAVELASYGMVGVGEVYRLFCSGELADDDEVALLHGPAEDGYRAVSQPMVNLRATFHRARDSGVISAGECAELVAAAKRLHFSRRTLESVLGAAAHHVPASVLDGVRRFWIKGYVDIKRADARLLLQELRDRGAPAPPSLEVEPPAFVRSRSFERLYNEDRTVDREGRRVSLRAIAARAALHVAEFDEVNFAALNRAAVQVLAQQQKLQPSDAEIDAEERRFRQERALCRDGDLHAWLRAHDLDARALRQLLLERATCRRVHRWLLGGSGSAHHTRWLLDELRLRGRYVPAADGAAHQIRALDDARFEPASLAELDDRALIGLLTDQQRATGWRPAQPLDVWAAEAGFDDMKDLAYELLWAARARAVESNNSTGGTSA